MALTAVEEAQLRDLIAQQSALLSLAGVEATILSKLGATKVTLSDLPSATVINDADLLLLRQGTTDKSVTGLTFKGLIPTISDASTTVKGIVELATNAETQTGTDTSRAITPENLKAIVPGFGQTLTNVLASRAGNTTYTNLSNRPLYVCIAATCVASANATLLLNGVSFGQIIGAGPSALNASFSILVPPGSTYRVNTSGTVTFTVWSELV